MPISIDDSETKKKGAVDDLKLESKKRKIDDRDVEIESSGEDDIPPAAFSKKKKDPDSDCIHRKMSKVLENKKKKNKAVSASSRSKKIKESKQSSVLSQPTKKKKKEEKVNKSKLTNRNVRTRSIAPSSSARLVPFDITSADLTDVEELWTRAPNPHFPDVKVVDLGNDSILEKNFLTLDDDFNKPDVRKWLNDEIIMGYTNLLKRKDSLSNDKQSIFFHTRFMSYLIDNGGYDYKNVSRWTRRTPVKDVFSAKYLFVPVNISQTHWSLIVGDMAKKKLLYFDSQGARGDRYLNAMMKYLADVSEKRKKRKLKVHEWTLLNMLEETPQQGNAYDCGLFICLTMYLTLHDIPVTFTQEDVYRCQSRRIIAYNLVEADKAVEKKASVKLLAPVEISGDAVSVTVDESESSTHRVVYEEPEVVAVDSGKNKRKAETILEADVKTENQTQSYSNSHSTTGTETKTDKATAVRKKAAKEPNEKKKNNDNNDDEVPTPATKKFKSKVTVVTTNRKEDLRDEYNLPVFRKFDVNYIKLELLLQIIFKGSIPSRYVGYRLITMRAKLQKTNLKMKDDQLGKYLKRTKEYLTKHWNNLCVKSAKNRKIDSNQVSKKNNSKNNDEDGKTHEINYPKRKQKKKTNEYESKTRASCGFAGCTNTHKTPNITFRKVPSYPKGKREDRKQLRDLVTYDGRVLLRDMTLKNMDRKGKNNKDVRICSCHKQDQVSVPHKIERPGKLPVIVSYTMCIPATDGVKETHIESESKGLSLDRASYQVVKNIVKDGSENLSLYVLRDQTEKDYAAERQKKNSASISRQVERMLNIEDHHEENDDIRMSVSRNTAVKGDRLKLYRSFDISNKETKKCTGFKTKEELLAFVAIVCNGEVTSMVEKKTKHLTWFEEWFFYFENIWMRTFHRVADICERYTIGTLTRDFIINDKLSRVLDCRSSWKIYCTHDEDVALRGSKWDGILHPSERIIMHDTTSLSMSIAYKPSGSGRQRITFNTYYGNKNVAKGNISLQPGGWVVTDHLWVGATTDDQYILNSRIFERQLEFAMEDLIDGTEYKAFIIILDRGYRLGYHAWKCGKQTVQQPVFKKEKRRFTGYETLKSATCASVRSGNERAVRKTKLCGWLRKGLLPYECPRRFDDVWVAWGFQCNFMYASNA